MTSLITSLIGHPERLDRTTLYQLRTVVARYPWYQTARLLLLNNLYLTHDPDFGHELRMSVLFVADRRTLCRLVHQLSPASTTLPLDVEPTVDRTLTLIDAFLQTQPEQSKTLVLDNPATTDYMAMLAYTEEHPDLLNGGITLSPDDSQPTPSTEEPEVHTQDDSVQPAFFTETLAQIYIKQHKYQRALEIIRSLYLQYPDKSAYFADQIKSLEQIIENNNIKDK